METDRDKGDRKSSKSPWAIDANKVASKCPIIDGDYEKAILNLARHMITLKCTKDRLQDGYKQAQEVFFEEWVKTFQLSKLNVSKEHLHDVFITSCEDIICGFDESWIKDCKKLADIKFNTTTNFKELDGLKRRVILFMNELETKIRSANRHRHVFMSHRKLATILPASSATSYRLLKFLEEAGYLKVVMKGTKKHSTRYTVIEHPHKFRLPFANESLIASR
jgi:hypothetical protein